jgi:predicted DCC family thiol-disulfide oxidoreductase YuxK
LLKQYGYPTDHFDTMLVLSNNKIYEKSDAFFVIVKQLGLPYRLVLVGKIIPLALRDWCYDRIAQNRYRWFGKYSSCPIDFSIDEKRYL